MRMCPCAAQVSDDVGICPECGKPVRSTGRRSLPIWVRILLALSVLGLVTGYWWAILVNHPEFQPTQPIQTNERYALQAIQMVQMVHRLQIMHYWQFGGYATSLKALAPDFASGAAFGYQFELQATEHGYVLEAFPEEFGKTGDRSFWSDQSLVIRESRTNQRATGASPPVRN
jgi:hypothetical protein